MGDKVLRFDKNQDRCIKFAQEYSKKQDYLKALTFLFDAMKQKETYSLYQNIARVYSDMELYELSNFYWFKYIYYAPKDKVSIGFEELAINYFYLDNTWASGYYFHKKLSIDGFVSEQNIDPEIMDFFSGEERKEHAYRIVYPHSLADYTLERTNAKRAIRVGDFDVATQSIEKIPNECRDEETLNDLCVSYIMTDDYENAEKTARYSIKKFGDNLNSYCNLSAIFELQKDYDNAEYYYRKALSLIKGEQDEWYKIVTCAIERADHLIVKKCLENILEERPFDYIMRFLYAISLGNLGEYEKSLGQMKKVWLINPRDIVIEYYVKQLKLIVKNGYDKEGVFPIKYNKEFPKKEREEYEKYIRELAKNPQKISSEIKKTETINKLIWGLVVGGDETMRLSVMILTNGDLKTFKEIAIKVLLNPDADSNVKRLLIYALILKAYKGRCAMVAGSYYCEFNLRKLLCEKKEGSDIYISSYALCVSRMIFYGIDDFTKMAKTTDKLFYEFGKEINCAEVNNEELAGLILSQSNYENFSKSQVVMSIFEIDKEKLEKLNNLVNAQKKGETDD